MNADNASSPGLPAHGHTDLSLNAASQLPRATGFRAWHLAGAVLTALVASACCVGPLLLILLGVGGAWMANLRILDPIAPYLNLAALGLLVYAHVKNYRAQRQTACGTCVPTTSTWKQVGLWAGTALVLVALAAPYVLPYLIPA